MVALFAPSPSDTSRFLAVTAVFLQLPLGSHPQRATKPCAAVAPMRPENIEDRFEEFDVDLRNSFLMWIRWAIVSSSAVLLMSMALLLSFDNTGTRISYQRLQSLSADPVYDTRVMHQEVNDTRRTRTGQTKDAIRYQTEPGLQELLPSKGPTRLGEGPFKGAGLRGFVEKQGMVPPTYFSAVMAKTRRSGWEDWAKMYTNGNIVSHAPTPFPHCQVYINHHYKFIWIKGHKVGSTAMRGPLGWLCDDNWRVPKNSNFSLCGKPLFKEDAVGVRIMSKWWKEYFVFGIVRNPYTRFASAEEYIGRITKKGCNTKPSFVQTCKDPYVHMKICRKRNCCFPHAAAHHYRHFMDQSTCLFTDSLLPAVDFIGETENLREDFDTIIREINRRRDPSLPALKNNLAHKNVHGRRLTSYTYDLFKNHKSCLSSVKYFYNKDFNLLQYEELTDLD